METKDLQPTNGGTSLAKFNFKELANLKINFPEVSKDWIKLLCERCEANGITAVQMREGINHLIDTSPYKQPTIADIILFIKPEIKEPKTELDPSFDIFIKK